MTLLLIIAAWAFATLLVVGLCATARLGDLTQEAVSGASGSARFERSSWEAVGRQEMLARVSDSDADSGEARIDSELAA